MQELIWFQETSDYRIASFSSYENEERKRVGICSPTQKRHFQLLKMTPYSKNVRLLLLSVLFGTDNLMLAVFDNCLKSFLWCHVTFKKI